MDPHRRTITAASAWGAALALSTACGGTVEVKDEGAGGAGGPGSTKSLEPPPPGECWDYDGNPEVFFGQCCERVVCGAAGSDGVCLAPDIAEEQHLQLRDYPSGSGDCACSDLVGPYANVADPSGDAPCCYLVAWWSVRADPSSWTAT